MSAADDLETIDDARARLARLAEELTVIRHRAAVLARETDWRSAAAEAFRFAVAEWETTLARVSCSADQLRDDLLSLRGRVLVQRHAEAEAHGPAGTS